MVPFTQNYPPSAQACLQSQFAMLAEWSKPMLDAVQKVGELNIQTAQTLMQESISSTRQILESQSPFEAAAIAMNQLHPGVEKLRAYQQHLLNITAAMQLDLARVAETHMPEASRTAMAMADEVARSASEEGEKVVQRQKAAMDTVMGSVFKTPEPGNGGTKVH
ncbi:phasin family protein [Noviherbaspirillum massiliense]|uniref:phasin family protein n=1 Tax=Noviherbaspirillum massiliense TaxID=1465823 RepID=UPI0002FDB844|nr:phasin family protein [Noviherbaspirillum massiliense]